MQSMFTILRNTDGGICRTGTGPVGSTSVGSQVSVLPSATSARPPVHWFTATPNPAASVFKPFIFVDGLVVSKHVVSPGYGATDPVKMQPRFKSSVDRRHDLYKAQELIRPLPGDDVNTKVDNLHVIESDHFSI